MVDNSEFQFILTQGDAIICQRYFNVNNFNTKAVRSVTFMETINEVCDLIKKSILKESRRMLWNEYDNNFSNNLNSSEDNINLKFTVLRNDKIITTRNIDMSDVQKNISIDIRDDIREIIQMIYSTLCLTNSKLNFHYLGTRL